MPTSRNATHGEDTALPIRMLEGHVVATINRRDYLVDTGSPTTIMFANDHSLGRDGSQARGHARQQDISICRGMGAGKAPESWKQGKELRFHIDGTCPQPWWAHVEFLHEVRWMTPIQR